MFHLLDHCVLLVDDAFSFCSGLRLVWFAHGGRLPAGRLFTREPGLSRFEMRGLSRAGTRVFAWTHQSSKPVRSSTLTSDERSETTKGGALGRLVGKAKAVAGAALANDELKREGNLQQAASEAEVAAEREEASADQRTREAQVDEARAEAEAERRAVAGRTSRPSGEPRTWNAIAGKQKRPLTPILRGQSRTSAGTSRQSKRWPTPPSETLGVSGPMQGRPQRASNVKRLAPEKRVADMIDPRRIDNRPDLQNKFVDGWLRVARLPFDVMAHLIPNGERGPRQGVTLAVDRADATIRAFAGAALGNDGLLLDANQRRAAADERARAIRLRTEAREQEVQADRRLDERRGEAERLRSRADREATEREEQAEQKRRARKEKLRETTARQQQRVETERQRKHSAAEHEAKEQRCPDAGREDRCAQRAERRAHGERRGEATQGGSRERQDRSQIQLLNGSRISDASRGRAPTARAA